MIRSVRREEVEHTIEDGIRVSLRSVHWQFVDALLGGTTVRDPVVFRVSALKHVAEQKGYGPHDANSDQGPDNGSEDLV